jgi:hypothetical protein
MSFDPKIVFQTNLFINTRLLYWCKIRKYIKSKNYKWIVATLNIDIRSYQ